MPLWNADFSKGRLNMPRSNRFGASPSLARFEI
jgi:hypothetical protein